MFGSFASMKALACIVIFCLGAGGVEGKLMSERCPTRVETVKPFDIKKYEGQWYTQFRTPFKEHVNDCTTTLIYYHDENGYYMKTFTLNNNKKPDAKRFVVYNHHNNGMFRTRSIGGEGYHLPITNWVVDTDYKTYSVRFSCYNKTTQSHQVISLQTRQQFPNDIVLNNLKIAASTAGFSLRHVERVRQKNCPNMVKDAPKDDDDDDDD